jgi:sugar-specific transcriptional regulator TrmB
METKTKTDPLQKVKVLTRLGLTSSQAKVYLSLVQTGTSTANTISKISNVPRPEVYVSMAKLEKRGLVEKVITHPFEYRATPPDTAILSLLKTKIKENRELRAEATALLREVSWEKRRSLKTEKNEFILIPKHEALLNRINEGIKSAEKSIYGVVPWKKLWCASHTFAEEWERAVKRGVEIHLVTDKPKELGRLPEFLEWVSSKNYINYRLRCNSDVARASVMIYDLKQLFIDTAETGGLAEAPALWSDNQCVIAIAQNYFESMWSKSSEYFVRTASLKQRL